MFLAPLLQKKKYLLLRIKSATRQLFLSVTAAMEWYYITFGFAYTLMNHSDFSRTSATEDDLYQVCGSNGNLLEMARMTQPIVGQAV